MERRNQQLPLQNQYNPQKDTNNNDLTLFTI